MTKKAYRKMSDTWADISFVLKGLTLKPPL